MSLSIQGEYFRKLTYVGDGGGCVHNGGQGHLSKTLTLSPKPTLDLRLHTPLSFLLDFSVPRKQYLCV